LVLRVEPRFSESIAEGKVARQEGAEGQAVRQRGAVRSSSGIEELDGLGFSALITRMVKVSGLEWT
jgi:hypothetical protein